MSIQKRIVHNEANDSVCQHLQEKIKEVTNTLIGELNS